MKFTQSVFLLLAISVFFNQNTFAQTANQTKVEQQFFTAYVMNSKPAWTIALNQLADTKDEALQLILAKGYYGAAGTAMGNRDEDLAGEMLDKAKETAKLILEKNEKSPEANALLSSIYGMKIGLSPIKGMFLGSKSAAAAEKGIELAPDNAFTNFVMGSYLYYTPSMFGGDAVKSLTYLEKSKDKYEAEDNTKSWEYLNTMALLGQAYHKQKQYDKARTTYETALKVAPNFGYIKAVLLPRTEKAAKS